MATKYLKVQSLVISNNKLLNVHSIVTNIIVFNHDNNIPDNYTN